MNWFELFQGMEVIYLWTKIWICFAHAITIEGWPYQLDSQKSYISGAEVDSRNAVVRHTSTQNVTVRAGREASITCVINEDKPPNRLFSQESDEETRVAWIKADTKAILAFHDRVLTNNERLHVLHVEPHTWSLHVRDARREDSGTYICQVNTDPHKNQRVHLEVVIPPDIINEETSGDIMVPEGGLAKLICRARGWPAPHIMWKREDGADIVYRTSTGSKARVQTIEGEVLILSKVTRNEMGGYLCIAHNGIPPSVSKKVMLQVNFHPVIQAPNQLIAAPLESAATLICIAESSPKPINYWTKESGEMIISNNKYRMMEQQVGVYTIRMTLIVKRVKNSDYGGYKCTSKNSIGEAEGSIRIYEMDAPFSETEENEIADEREFEESGQKNVTRRRNDVCRNQLNIVLLVFAFIVTIMNP